MPTHNQIMYHFISGYTAKVAGTEMGVTDPEATFSPCYGAAFLVCTALEWHGLIFDHGLTLSTNLFGTTYYALVGFHAAHVVVGLLLLSGVLVLAARGHVRTEHTERVDLLSWYWHFVDTVWIAVLTVVYVVGI